MRHAAAGQVRLWVDGQPIEGRLLDCSETGFRLASASGELATGVDVDFVIGSRTGRARVVWNRFTSKHWESGLLIL
ncbi:MAG: PilZ domain-containing protein [Bryobacteraceae bacterium]|nr:PilZ domain-containing protein [Bryobacteraceae bacterium]